MKIGNVEYNLSVIKNMTKKEFLKLYKGANAEQHAEILPLKKELTKLVKKGESEDK